MINKLKTIYLYVIIFKKIPSCKLMKMKFTAGRERYMMHCNNIEKCMANQSTKGMKKGLHLLGDIIRFLI
jgi:translation initiation factor 2 beta subunit (eIF-2beta)/eIF-5